MSKFDELCEEILSEGSEAQLKYELPARKKVLKDILGLSSGTLGSLTNETNSTKIDKIQNAFFDHAINSGIVYKDWNDAWRVFLDDFGIKYDKKGVINAKDIKKIIV